MSEATNKLHSMELRVPELEGFLGVLTKIHGYASTWNEMPDKKQAKFIEAALKRLRSLKSPHGLKPTWTAVFNELLSVKDVIGDEDQTVEFPELKRGMETTQSVIDSLKSKIVAMKEDGVEDLYLRDEASHCEETIASSEKETQKLLSSKKRSWCVAKAPVIPIPNNAYFNFQRIERHFRTTPLGGYPILHDQTVIGVNRKKERDVKGIFNQVLAKLKERKGKNFILMYPQGRFAPLVGKDVVWFWIMPEDQANEFRKCFTNYGKAGVVGTKTLGLQSISLRDWGFANGNK